MDDLDVYDFFDFPEPPAFTLQYPSGPSLTAMAEPNARKMHLFKLGDNHLEVYRAQRLLNCYIRGNIGTQPWTRSNGSLWPLLPENGILNSDTQLALSQFQSTWGLQSTGCLCPRTRMLLPPFMRLTGSLILRKPGRRVRLGLPPNYAVATQPNRLTTPAPSPSPSSGTKSAGDDDDDDDKPWTIHITGSYGVGASGPLWTGKSSTGASVKADTLEVDQKTEIDVTVPTPVVIGQGRLKLTLAGEWDRPLDAAHSGKPTVQATFQLQADDALKFGKWGSLAPFVQASSQWTSDDNKMKQSTVLKGGLEMDVNLTKGLKLAADVNSGAQFSGPGNDAATTPKVVVPFEGNLKLQWDF